MRTCRVLSGAIVGGLGVFGLLTQVGLAGPLVPPSGPVAPSFKTLQQVEPRIPISDATTPGNAAAMAVITQPGSYYLTSDLVVTGGRVGLQILAPNVTVDLNGMTISAGEGSIGSTGVIDDTSNEDARQIISIRNGRIVGFNSTNRHAVYLTGNTTLSVTDLVIADCFNGAVSENGPVNATGVQLAGTSNTAGVGIRGDGGSLFAGCKVRGFAIGIDANEALVRDCVVDSCGLAIETVRSRVERCTITNGLSGQTVGISVGAYSSVVGCMIYNTIVGVQCSSLAAIVEDCFIVGCDTGVSVTADNVTVRRNAFKQCTSSNGNGACIRVGSTGTRATITDNSGERFDFGIIINASGALVTGNRFGHPLLAGSAIYQFVAGTRFGPVVRSQTGAALSVSSATPGLVAGTMGSTDPTANFYW